MRFEVLTAVKMSMLLFWIVTPCGLVGRYQGFGGTYCFHLQGWYLPAGPHGISTQKTKIDLKILCLSSALS
jgi:hypothetical protein